MGRGICRKVVTYTVNLESFIPCFVGNNARICGKLLKMAQDVDLINWTRVGLGPEFGRRDP